MEEKIVNGTKLLWCEQCMLWADEKHKCFQKITNLKLEEHERSTLLTALNVLVDAQNDMNDYTVLFEKLRDCKTDESNFSRKLMLDIFELLIQTANNSLLKEMQDLLDNELSRSNIAISEGMEENE